MAWNTLGNNDFIHGNDLQNAVSTGVFVIREGQSIPNNNTFLTKSSINSLIYVNIDSGVGETTYPTKSQLVAPLTNWILSSIYYSTNPTTGYVSTVNIQPELEYAITGTVSVVYRVYFRRAVDNVYYTKDSAPSNIVDGTDGYGVSVLPDGSSFIEPPEYSIVSVTPRLINGRLIMF